MTPDRAKWKTFLKLDDKREFFGFRRGAVEVSVAGTWGGRHWMLGVRRSGTTQPYQFSVLC